MAGNEIVDVALCTRLAGPEHLEGIGEILPLLGGPFYHERFPGRTSAQFCRWKYFENPAGEAAVGIALDGDRVVSVVAGTPKRILLGEKTVVAFELGDFITLGEYRGRGLFSALINMVCDAARERGAAFVYVRPNEVSFPILANRLAFQEPAKIDLRRYVVLSDALQRKIGMPSAIARGLGVDWLMEKLTLPASSNSINIKRIDRFDDRFDQLWNASLQSYSFSLVRDSSFLNWRYVDCPTPYQRWLALRGSEVAGYLVSFASATEPTGIVVDLFTHPADVDAAAALVRAAIADLQRRGKSVIYTWTVQQGLPPAAANVLKRVCRFATEPSLHMAVKFLSAEAESEGLPLDGWQLAAGDFDGV